MLTTAQIVTTATELAKHGDIRLTPVVRLLFDLADQLGYLEERESISDSRIQLLRTMDDNCKEEVQLLQDKLAAEHVISVELRKQISILKEALVK